MQLPDDKEKALIVNVETLPERLEQLVMEILNSPEGQQAGDLADTLGRRMVPEQRVTVLTELHNRGYLRAETIDNIIMFPRPNSPFPLRDLLAAMGKLDGVTAATADTGDSDGKYNQHVQNKNVAVTEEKMATAMNILAEAEMLQLEANRKREQAYKIAPGLRPEQTAIKEVAAVTSKDQKAEAKAK
jgi:hypothetical protein